MRNIADTEVFSKFMSPLIALHSENPYSRICEKIPDVKWLKLGVMRALSEDRSGRGFLQNLLYRTQELIGVGVFFEALKSERRLNYLKFSLLSLVALMKTSRKNSDVFSTYKELNAFHIYGGDGHYHSSATHDLRIEGKKYSTQHFYAQNMRSQAMTHLALAEIGEERKKEHDMRALKKAVIETLRQGASKGEKVLYVWDRASLDFPQWDKWKQRGIYFLSRSKKGMQFETLESIEVDSDDDVNNGVKEDQVVITNSGVKLRRVLYLCPFQNKTYSFITNLPKTIRPGIIAFLYKTRWDIEKVFDDFKNKMDEKKSWGSHDNTKTAQAIFLCLAYNLSLLLEDNLDDEGVNHEKNVERKKKRIEHDIKNAKIPSYKISSLIKSHFRVTQRPFALFRWIRSFLFLKVPWNQAIELLRLSYLKLA